MTTDSPAHASKKRIDLLLRVSVPHKLHAVRAFAMQQAATWATVISVFFAHRQNPLQSDAAMQEWAGVFLCSWLVRMLMFVPLYRLAPAQLEVSKLLKALPLLSGLIGSAFWIWTTVLFTGPVLTMREMTLCVGLLSISVSMTGMWPVTPAPLLVVYYLLMWTAFSFNIWLHGIASVPPLLALNASVVLVLWLSVFVSTLQVNAHIARGIELDTALAALQKTNETLEKLKDAAYETLHTRSQLFSETSHDFRRRLVVAKRWVSAVTGAVSGNESAQRPLARLVYELDSLRIDVDNILEFARTESMNAPVHLRATPLQDIFDQVASNFDSVVVADGKRLRIRSTGIVIGTDEAMLVRMIENLVSNALKFTRKGVLVCARQRGRLLSIEVWDQGPGIRSDAHAHIFKAFHRDGQLASASADADRQRGIGLGLAIAQRLASRMNYVVDIASAVGRGSVFRIGIPVEFLTGAERRPVRPRRAAP